MAETGSEFIPIYGDAKSFAEAESGFDYLIAVLGIAPGVGDAGSQVLKKAKALYHEGEVKAAADLVESVAAGAKETGGAITKISDEMKASPYHPDWQRYTSDIPRDLGSAFNSSATPDGKPLTTHAFESLNRHGFKDLQ